jgi:hypothetical protein
MHKGKVEGGQAEGDDDEDEDDAVGKWHTKDTAYFKYLQYHMHLRATGQSPSALALKIDQRLSVALQRARSH